MNNQENQQTLTVDNCTYSVDSLPPEAINLVNDILRSEQELNEHRFRIRQISTAAETLKFSLKQLLENENIEPIKESEESANEEQIVA